MSNAIKIVRGNDLIFENGNEHGSTREPLYVAACGALRGHGSTPDKAIDSLKESRRARAINESMECEGSTPD